MNAREAREHGARIAALVQAGKMRQAHFLLAPVLAERTPFRFLGRIGEAVGAGSLDEVNLFLEHIAAEKTEGGWVVIASALGAQLGRDLAGGIASRPQLQQDRTSGQERRPSKHRSRARVEASGMQPGCAQRRTRLAAPQTSLGLKAS